MRDLVVVLAPDKFKGSLTAAQVATQLRAGMHDVDPRLDIRAVPVADGGEGTVDAALARGFDPVPVTVRGPMGDPVEAVIAVQGPTAVVELAQASGLHLVPLAELAPLRATSFGTGELLLAALDAGCTSIVLGIGGSATTDGGAGLAQALGVRFLDADGAEVEVGRAHPVTTVEVDLSGVDPRLADVDVVVATDVDNPLCGPSGAAAVFGPQKQASPRDVEVLDEALRRWAELLLAATGASPATSPGDGAAGGVGFAARVLLAADVRSGIEVMLDLGDVASLLGDARLVVTGEGSLDSQSLGGKTPVGVARAAGAAGVPTVAVAGRVLLTGEQASGAGFAAVYSLQDREPDLEVCLAEAPRLVREIGAAIALEWLR